LLVWDATGSRVDYIAVVYPNRDADGGYTMSAEEKETLTAEAVERAKPKAPITILMPER
jgi:hypothetical protein